MCMILSLTVKGLVAGWLVGWLVGGARRVAMG